MHLGNNSTDHGSMYPSFAWQAIPASVPQEPHSTAQPALNTAQVKKPAKSGNRFSVYLDTHGVEFPLTSPGERAMVKVRVVNKSSDLKVGMYYSEVLQLVDNIISTVWSH